ncbi:MAG TPA: secondary thiamine-phosphate synthase enzyme YjbQ [Candidatus Eisenbacteria bacterium]|nr:secondary thiamine-phosphate synthase enzyme YjbQ [Candidatus Eisenbacteria bacterium]
MPAHRLTLETRARTEFGPLSGRLAKEGRALLRGDGLLHVYVPHTTAGVCVNEGYDPDVVADVERVLDRLVPWSGGYRHAEGNSAAHVKSILVGSSVWVPVRGGALALGRWQEVFFCEFDGPRTRSVELTFLPA